VRFQVLAAASMKFRIVFWDVMPCKIIVERRYRGTCCLQQQGDHPDDGGSKYLWNVGRQLFYTAVHPRRQIWAKYIFLFPQFPPFISVWFCCYGNHNVFHSTKAIYDTSDSNLVLLQCIIICMSITSSSLRNCSIHEVAGMRRHGSK
jgi:hypothetical protein